MFRRLMRVSGLAAILAAIMAMGCQAEIPPTDPGKARDTLKTALDAWKSGESAEAFTARSSITAVDPRWQEGAKLLSYDVQGDGKADGFDWQCRVNLSLKDTKGKAIEEKAIYNISTAPAFVVVRNEN